MVLGAIQRHVGVAQQQIRVGAVVGKQRDADAGSDVQPVAVDEERFGQRLDQLLRHDGGAARIDQVGLDEDEFVAADTGQRVARAQSSPQPHGDPLQQSVADRMAEGVVDVLEVIEIHHHHRDALPMPPGAGQRLAQAVAQHDAVRQSGQGVVVSQTVDVVERRDPLGDVLDQRQDRDLAAVLGMECRIVPLAVTNLPLFRVTTKAEATIGTPACGQLSPDVGRPLDVALVDEADFLRRPADDLALGPTKDRLCPTGPATHTWRLAGGVVLLPFDDTERGVVDVLVEHGEGTPQFRLGALTFVDLVPELLIGLGQLAHSRLEFVIGPSQRLLGLESLRDHVFSFRNIAYGCRNQQAFFRLKRIEAYFDRKLLSILLEAVEFATSLRYRNIYRIKKRHIACGLCFSEPLGYQHIEGFFNQIISVVFEELFGLRINEFYFATFIRDYDGIGCAFQQQPEFSMRLLQVDYAAFELVRHPIERISNYADFIPREYLRPCAVEPPCKRFCGRMISVKPLCMFLLTDMASSNPDISTVMAIINRSLSTTPSSQREPSPNV